MVVKVKLKREAILTKSIALKAISVELEFLCWVTVSQYDSFVWRTKVMETVSALWILVMLIIFFFFFRKTTFLRVIILVLRVPGVFEYSHDRHAKKNAPLHRSAIWEAKWSSLGRVQRWERTCGVITFCAFSFGSDFLKDRVIDWRWEWMFPSASRRGSCLSLFVKEAAMCERDELIVPAISGSVYRGALCSHLRREIAKPPTKRAR